MNSTHIIPTQTKEHREHVQSKDCWCNPVVIPPDYDWDNDPDGLVAKAMEEELDARVK